MRLEHGGELALARLESFEAALQAGIVRLFGRVACMPGRRGKQRDAGFAIGKVQQRFVRRLQPGLLAWGEQRGLQQGPQWREPGMFASSRR